MQIAPLGTEQSPEVAAVFRRARATLTFLPDLHSPQDQHRFLRDHVLAKQTVLGARVDGVLRGFIATEPSWVEHLYIDPDTHRQGLGTALLARAKAQQPYLQLWCFQANDKALNFYAKQGFAEVKRTDGAGNMENCPDVLLDWRA